MARTRKKQKPKKNNSPNKSDNNLKWNKIEELKREKKELWDKMCAGQVDSAEEEYNQYDERIKEAEMMCESTKEVFIEVVNKMYCYVNLWKTQHYFNYFFLFSLIMLIIKLS